MMNLLLVIAAIFAVTVGRTDPPKINKNASPTPVYSYVGNTKAVTITCEFYGYPVPIVIMYAENGTEIATGNTTVSYTLKTTTNKDFGKFNCTAENSEGKAEFGVELKLAVPPGPLRNVTANITCKVLSLKWQHPVNNGGMEILNYTIHVTVLSNGTQLIMENADRFSVERDIGYNFKPATRYEILLKARSEAGIGKEETVFVTTDKYSLPFVNTIASPSTVYSYIGNRDPTWLRCKFGGYPNPWVTMRFGEKLKSNATTSAEVKLITDAIKYFGVYKCHAENDCGFKNYSVELKLARKPSEVLNFKAVPTCNSITLTWRTPTDDGGMPINKYVLTYKGVTRNIDGDDTTYTINDLKQNTKYSISLRATSKAEWGPISSVEVQTTTYCSPGRPIIYSLSSTWLAKNTFTLKWRAPQKTGDDDDITYTMRYRVEDKNNHGPWKTITTKKLQVEISDLNNTVWYTWYKFEVTAKNKGGESDPAEKYIQTNFPVFPEPVPSSQSRLVSSAFLTISVGGIFLLL